jgi:hypothetical protein
MIELDQNASAWRRLWTTILNIHVQLFPDEKWLNFHFDSKKKKFFSGGNKSLKNQIKVPSPFLKHLFAAFQDVSRRFLFQSHSLGGFKGSQKTAKNDEI